jgi:hypothetical protein
MHTSDHSNGKLARLLQQYTKGLEYFLRHGTNSALESALIVGHTAATHNLDTLALAHIHTQALSSIRAAISHHLLAKRSALYFNTANNPIEKHILLLKKLN